jgi:dephospho-CoA kinase
MPSLILGLTGQIGSGKGYICDYLVEHYGAEMFKFSTYLSRSLEVMALENSRDNLIKMSETLRRTFGEDALSHAVAYHAAKSSAPISVIDGIRRVQDLKELETQPNFKLAAVDADQKIRYERIANRGEKSDEAELTWEQFLDNEMRSTEVTVPETMTRATLRITNNGTQADLERQIDALMAQHGISKKV